MDKYCWIRTSTAAARAPTLRRFSLGAEASDVEFLARAARGDRAAIARLYARHGA